MLAINERLWIENGAGAARAHRVVPIGPPRLAEVDGRRCRAVEVREIGCGSARLVPEAELTPAAPLSAADLHAYELLDRQLAGTLGDARLLAKFNALRLRAVIFGEAGNA